MSIKDRFVPYAELLELFDVQRVNALTRCLKQSDVAFLLDKSNKPLVLRSALEGGVKEKLEDAGIVPPGAS